jgi:hypothetical protein
MVEASLGWRPWHWRGIPFAATVAWAGYGTGSGSSVDVRKKKEKTGWSQSSIF